MLVSEVEKQLIAKTIKEGSHVDFRPLITKRSRSFRYTEVNKTCLVSDYNLGPTNIHCRVHADITKPQETRRHLGLFSVNIHFLPFPTLEPQKEDKEECSFSVSSLTKDREREFHIKEIIKNALFRTRLIDFERLCLITSKSVWHVKLDIYIKNDFGNLYEAVFDAAYLSLYNFYLPSHKIVDDKIELFSAIEKDPWPLIVREKLVLDTSQNILSEVKLVAVYCYKKDIEIQKLNKTRNEKMPENHMEKDIIIMNSENEMDEIESDEEGEIPSIEGSDNWDYIIDPSLEEELVCRNVFIAVMRNENEFLYTRFLGEDAIKQTEFLNIVKVTQKIFKYRVRAELLNN